MLAFHGCSFTPAPPRMPMAAQCIKLNDLPLGLMQTSVPYAHPRSHCAAQQTVIHVLPHSNAEYGSFLWYNISIEMPRAAANSRGNGRSVMEINMDNHTTKRCAKCGTDFPLSAFHKDVTQRIDRLARYCKVCVASYSGTRASAHVSEKRCPMCATTKPIADFHKNKRSANGHHTYCKQCVQWMHSQNADTHRATASAYNKTYPERVVLYQRRARAKRSGAEGSHTKAEWDALCAYYDYKCLACGKRKPLTVDHIVPLVKGGCDSIENLQPLCGSCNSRKKDKATDYRRGDDGV
jgi:5-methylcytosine-specific restriction endonuclease McrA